MIHHELVIYSGRLRPRRRRRPPKKQPPWPLTRHLFIYKKKKKKKKKMGEARKEYSSSSYYYKLRRAIVLQFIQRSSGAQIKALLFSLGRLGLLHNSSTLLGLLEAMLLLQCFSYDIF